MNGEKIQPRHFVTSCLLMVAGVALFYPGLVAGKLIATAGVATLLAGFSIATYALLRVLFNAKEKDSATQRKQRTLYPMAGIAA